MQMDKEDAQALRAAALVAQSYGAHSTHDTLMQIAEKYAPTKLAPAREPPCGQQVVDFEGLGECFYEHEGLRAARPGEFYLSGAIVRAYKAPQGTTSPYQIVKPTARALRLKAGPWRYGAGEPVRV